LVSHFLRINMKNLLGFALGLAVLLGSCSQDRKNEAIQALSVPDTASAPPPLSARVNYTPPVLAEESELQDTEPAAATVPPPRAAPRLLIYHAELRLKVDNLPTASRQLDSLVRQSGGYLSAAEETRQDGEWRQDMTIRVQPGRFQSILAALGQLGTVENKKLTTDDVTAEHADVAARLRTKRAVEQRYVALLDRARKISEILEIEAKIGEVREEIESTESRLKTMNDEVAYSTITLTCYQPLPQPTPDAPIVSLGSRIVEAFYGGWSLLTSLLVGTVAIWPLLVLGGIAWWALRRWRRKSLATAS
jgi:hypothetical protein